MSRTTDVWRVIVSALTAMAIVGCSADRAGELDEMVVPKQLSCSVNSEANLLPPPYWFVAAQIVRNDSTMIVVEMNMSSLPPERYSNVVGNPPTLTNIWIYMLDGGSWEDRPLGINRVLIEMERISRPATASRTVEVESDDPENLFGTTIESQEEWPSPQGIQVLEAGNSLTVIIEPEVFPNLRAGKDFHTSIIITHQDFRNTLDTPSYSWPQCK